MNLTTIVDVRRAQSAADDQAAWQEGDAWLAGGTWLFSEPQPNLRRLIDLRPLGWEPLTITDDGLRIAATCRIADLYAFPGRPEWPASFLIGECCRAFLASFKIWNAATVGGNIVMSLPAGPMISLSAALEGRCQLRGRDGTERDVAVVDFVTGDNQNILQPGELLEAIVLPASALRKRAAFRRVSMTHLGRSTALIIGTAASPDAAFTLTVTAATPRPVQLTFPAVPDARALRQRLAEAIPDDGWFADVHGAPDYRKHMTTYFAEQIRAELANPAA
ncbi:MAG TPA: FAD binding domain-containing protein [Thermomicrobiales bacterium]|nr:FAD binding domain-containing protein [Thermomicrobiales bacterium]